MARVAPTSQQLADDPRTKRELARLNRILAPVPEAKRRLAQGLVERAAFLAVLLADLEADMLANGWVEEYSNGPHQTGRKPSTAANIHQSALRNYAAVMRQLSQLVQGDLEGQQRDELLEFVRGGSR